ncbi:class I SAM-dependent methyltransferase [Isoptericola sp. b490]|uniref:class I SAM-dependent methyltransferase n=1 Tax=Actinotalea lenta TaxID=3064654 RepID=UPI0027133B57|nr:class I SAM-dependent methyltransferase [Isoptericola sp. b490]MDO8121432.1 class I SAM-dependent methyltransferase [Isoptericola sp. b490]
MSTAMMSCAARAAHVLVDRPPFLLTDELAVALAADHEALSFHRRLPAEPILAGARASTVLRSRFAEDRLAASSAEQYVVLGAGLDTSAERSARPLTAFAVDLPDALEDRREAFARAGLTPSAIPVPWDLGQPGLLDQLARAGLDLSLPAVVAWLGVTMYLTPASVDSVLGGLGRLAPGSELVMDHLLPRGERDAAGAGYAAAVGVLPVPAGSPGAGRRRRTRSSRWCERGASRPSGSRTPRPCPRRPGIARTP